MLYNAFCRSAPAVIFQIKARRRQCFCGGRASSAGLEEGAHATPSSTRNFHGRFFACIHQNYVRAPAVMRASGKKRRVAKTRHFHTSYKNAVDARTVIIFHYPSCPCAKRCRVCYFRLPNPVLQMCSGIYGREN
jgi:hypothetical protein